MRLLYVPALLALSADVLAQKCFFPNGQPSGSDTACNPDSLVSACCFDNQACLSNGLCVSDPRDPVKARLHRGTCTDEAWKSGNCPRHCLDIDNNGVPVYGCNSTTLDSYCCFDNCECNNPRFESFDFAQSPADVYTVTIIGESFTQKRPSTSTTSSSSSSATPSQSSSPVTTDASATASPKSSQSNAQASPPATSADPSPNPTTTPSLQNPPESKGSDKIALGVGLGVGLPIAALLLVGGFFLYRRRKRASAYPAAIELGGDGYSKPSAKYAYIAEAEVGSPRSELHGEAKHPVELPDNTMPAFSSRKA